MENTWPKVLFSGAGIGLVVLVATLGYNEYRLRTVPTIALIAEHPPVQQATYEEPARDPESLYVDIEVRGQHFSSTTRK